MMAHTLETDLEYFFKKKYSFAAYCLPDEDSIITIASNTENPKEINDFYELQNKKGFVVSPFYKNDTYPTVLIESDQIVQYPKHQDTEPCSINKPLDLNTKEQENYLRQIDNILTEIDKKKINKVILSRIISYPKLSLKNATTIFKTLVQTYPNAFVSLVHLPNIGSWIGASPEILLDIKKNEISTVALAGTKALKHNGETEKWTEKEIEEQQIVCNYIEDIFNKLAIENVKKEKTQTVIAGNIAHLRTKYRIKNNAIDIGELLEHLHPTPAVCGIPKEASLEIIQNTEKHHREYYTGFWGTVNIHDSTQLFVNIRTMKLMENKINIYVGGGITQKSTPQKEWEETNLKAERLINTLEKIYESKIKTSKE